MKTLLFSLALMLPTFNVISQSLSNENFTVDHLYIRCANNKEIEAKFREIGFTTLSGNFHTGQGTVGSYVMLENMYIEFLSVYNEKDFKANNELNHLESNDRFSATFDSKETTNSPFGLLFHLNNYRNDNVGFETFKYHQSWMKSSSYILLAKTNISQLQEPAIMILSESMKYKPKNYSKYTKHENEVNKVTSIEVVTNKKDKWSKSLTTMTSIPDLEFIHGNENLLIITFDNNGKGENIDMRPELPVILKF